MDISKLDPGEITIAVSGLSVLLTLHFTFQLLSQHLFYWKNPTEQKSILFIIMIAPVSAACAFAGLLDVKDNMPFFMLLDSFKACYEAFVIEKFMVLMYSYLNISMSDSVVPDEIKGREVRHLFPMTFFQPRKTHLNNQTLKLLKHWTWQFVVIRPVCSILMVTLQILRLYPSWLNWTFNVILFLSSSLAIYSLLVFYNVFGKELEPRKPLTKFTCTMWIVFFCFWQGLVFDMLVSRGILQSHHFWLHTAHLGGTIQNVLVCIEMVMFSVLHQYAYYVLPYSGDIEARLKLKRND